MHIYTPDPGAVEQFTFEAFTTERQNTKGDAPPALRRMVVEASQTFDNKVLRLRLEDEDRHHHHAQTTHHSRVSGDEDGMAQPGKRQILVQNTLEREETTGFDHRLEIVAGFW
ncbi:hypothetical protein MMC07_007277 [Pseudocyphellaria aurata]|nr:hypothetical protein [Pseudocyphellaria aurata]